MEDSLHRIRRAIDTPNRQGMIGGASNEADEFDLAEVTAGLWRNKGLIIFCTLAALLLGYLYAYHFADRSYRSTATLVLRYDTEDTIDGQIAAQRQQPLSTEEINTERAVVVSTTNLGAVAEELGLIDDPEFNPYLAEDAELPAADVRDEVFLTATVRELQQVVRAENVAGTTIVRVVAEASTPQKAQDIANALIAQYLAQQESLIADGQREDVERLSNRLEELQNQRIAIEARIDEFQFTGSDALQELRDTVELEKLAAEADANRELYEAVLGQYSRATVEQGSKRTESTVLDRAVLPIRHYQPREKLILAASILIGGFLGTCLALALDVFSDRIRGPRALGRLTGSPVIAAAPKFNRFKRYGSVSRQFGLSRPGSIAAMESIRTSVTLISDNRSRAPQAIAVISGTPEEGKSPLTLALAASYASAGAQILLIDTDLRQRTVSKWLAPAQQTGLISVLSGYETLHDAVATNRELGIDILPCEVTPRNPLDLLTSDQFEKLMEAARLDYDIILIDTAPMLAVSDGRPVCKQADFILYAANQNQTIGRNLTETLTDLGTIGERVDAVVLSEAQHGLFDGARKQLRQRYISNVGTADVRTTTTPTET